MLVIDVADKTEGRRKPGPTPKPDEARSATLVMRCHPDFKDWATRYAKSKGMNVSSLLDLALLAMARADKFEMPPER